MPFPILFEIFLITEIWTFGGTSSEDFGPYLNPVFDKHAAGRRGTAPISAHVAPSVLRMSPGTHVSLPPQTRPLLALRTGLCTPVLGAASPRPLGGDSVRPCPQWGKSLPTATDSTDEAVCPGSACVHIQHLFCSVTLALWTLVVSGGVKIRTPRAVALYGGLEPFEDVIF